MNRTLFRVFCFLGLVWLMAFDAESGAIQKPIQPSEVQLPDCSERTACLCPWRGLLSLNDFASIDPTRIPGNVLLHRHQDQCAWHVVQTAQGVKVFHFRSDYRRNNDVLSGDSIATHQPWNERGARLVVPVDDGYIVARNSGEWGAGIWWLSKDRRSSVQLGENHVSDLISTPKGIIATAYHDTADYSAVKGDILLIERAPSQKWRIKNLAETDRPALSAALADDGTLYVITGNQLVQLALDGTARVLHEGTWSAYAEVHEDIDYLASLAPTSLLLLPDGEILIGMHAVVARLKPGPDGYTETWFAPRHAPESDASTSPASGKAQAGNAHSGLSNRP